MKVTGDLHSWLPWVIKIRFVIITFVFAIDYAIEQISLRPGMAPIPLNIWADFGHSLVYPEPVFPDLQSAQSGFLAAGPPATFCRHFHHHGHRPCHGRPGKQLLFALPGGHYSGRHPAAEGASFPGGGSEFYPDGRPAGACPPAGALPGFAARHPSASALSTSSAAPVDLATLQVKILASLFGFFAVAYLASFLAETLRNTGAELRDKTGTGGKPSGSERKRDSQHAGRSDHNGPGGCCDRTESCGRGDSGMRAGFRAGRGH